MSKGSNKTLKLAGAIIVVAALIAGGYSIYSYQESLIPKPIPQSPTLQITHLSKVTGGNGFDQLGYAEAVDAIVNGSSTSFANPVSGKVVFIVTLERTDTLSGVHQFQVNLGKDPIILNETNPSNDAFLVSQTNGLQNVTFSSSQGTDTGTNFTIGLSAGQQVNVTVTVILNPQAILNLHSENLGAGITPDSSYEVYFGGMDAMLHVLAYEVTS